MIAKLSMPIWTAMILRRRSRRKDDKIAFAVVSNAIKKDHQNYLAAGGLYAWSTARRKRRAITV